MVQRLTYRRRKSYNTPSNKVRVVKTPGGKLTVHYAGKKASRPKCGDCGTALQGIPALRPMGYKSIAYRDRTVARAYGGSRCATCVRERIVRAFLIEEQKIVKAVLKEREAADAAKKAKEDKAAAKKAAAAKKQSAQAKAKKTAGAAATKTK